MMKTKILLFFCITAAIDAAAAVSSVSCSIEPQQIRIGEHVSLHYEFNQQPGDEVSVPLFSDTVVRGVELVENAKFDTLELKDGLIQVNMDLIATSFDSGFYYIPAMPFACNGDTLLSRALGLSVNTVEVNPDMDDVKDIKPVMSAPFSWQEFFTWSGIALAVIAGLAIIAFVLIKYVFKKKVPFISKTPEPQLPPHEEALLRLQQVKDEKLWQSGKIKEFYTEITDILREYMDRRFGINAMELTSEQILAFVRKNPEMEEVRQLLRQMLELSDLVKFAKFIPLEDENQRSMSDAFAFVEKTAPADAPAAEDASEDGQNANEQNKEDKK